jgi:hypothetical protein
LVNLGDPLVEKLLYVLDGYPSDRAYSAAKRLALFLDAFGRNGDGTPFSVSLGEYRPP